MLSRIVNRGSFTLRRVAVAAPLYSGSPVLLAGPLPRSLLLRGTAPALAGERARDRERMEATKASAEEFQEELSRQRKEAHKERAKDRENPMGTRLGAAASAVGDKFSEKQHEMSKNWHDRQADRSSSAAEAEEQRADEMEGTAPPTGSAGGYQPGGVFRRTSRDLFTKTSQTASSQEPIWRSGTSTMQPPNTPAAPGGEKVNETGERREMGATGTPHDELSPNANQMSGRKEVNPEGSKGHPKASASNAEGVSQGSRSAKGEAGRTRGESRRSADHPKGGATNPLSEENRGIAPSGSKGIHPAQ